MKLRLLIEFVHFLFALCYTFTKSLQSKEKDEFFIENIIDPSTDGEWVPRVRLPKRARHVKTPLEALRLVQEGVRSIGKQMNVPDIPHEFELGDGTIESMKVQARKIFRHPGLGGMEDIINFGIDRIGASSESIDTTEAFKKLSVVAERTGARSVLNQLAPIIQSTTPPNPNSMFNLIGSIMKNTNMPTESVEFMHKLAEMYNGGKSPTHEQFSRLKNMTHARLRQRTLPRVGFSLPQTTHHIPGIQDLLNNHTRPGSKQPGTLGFPDYFKKNWKLHSTHLQTPLCLGRKSLFLHDE